jgi:hypothetical protein
VAAPPAPTSLSRSWLLTRTTFHGHATHPRQPGVQKHGPLVTFESNSGNVDPATLHSLLRRRRPSPARTLRPSDQRPRPGLMVLLGRPALPRRGNSDPRRSPAECSRPRVTSPISGSLHATSARACAASTNAYRMSGSVPARRVPNGSSILVARKDRRDVCPVATRAPYVDGSADRLDAVDQPDKPRTPHRIRSADAVIANRYEDGFVTRCQRDL